MPAVKARCRGADLMADTTSIPSPTGRRCWRVCSRRHAPSSSRAPSISARSPTPSLAALAVRAVLGREPDQPGPDRHPPDDRERERPMSV